MDHSHCGRRRPRLGAPLWRRLGLALGSCLAGGCASPQHSAPEARRVEALRLPQAGDRVAVVGAYAGIPVLQKSLLWDGNGETDHAGVKARALWFASDRIALGAGSTVAGWFPSGHDVLAGEAEALLRWYFRRDPGVGWFADLAGGYVHSTDPIPPGGTEWNFTFSFGPGFDAPVARNLDLVGTASCHHISNALGRQNERNPSQNDVQLLLGIALRF